MTMQPPGVLNVDIEAWAAQYLQAALDTSPKDYAAGAYVCIVKPATNTPKTVLLRRDGGLQRGVLDYPRLTVRVYDDSEDTASALAYLVQALLLRSPLAVDSPVKRAVVLSGPQGIPDDAQSQKYLSVELVTKGTDL